VPVNATATSFRLRAPRRRRAR